MHYRGVVFGFALLLAFGVDARAKTPVRPAMELDQLLGPIALYPDPVVAQILPAATAPEDLELAVKFLEGGGTLDQVDAQPWNDNAKALARWPEVLRMMNRSRDWTDAVGAAFLDQSEDVLNSIQRLRAAALGSGALRTTNEQRIVTEKGIICIYPAEPGAIHLPQYDADKVFIVDSSSDDTGLVTFTSVLLVGYWVHHELDWRKHRLYSYDYQEFPFGRRNPWYFGGGTGEVPPNLPKQRNDKWEPDRNKLRPRINLNEPLPTIQHPSGSAPVLGENEPARPATESRPLAAPKDLPPPPPVLTPVDPEMDPVEEPPVKNPPHVDAGAQKGAVTKPVPAKAVKAKPAPLPAKSRMEKPAQAETVPVKKVKGKPVAADSAKAKAAPAKPTTKKGVHSEPEAKKAVPAKSNKAKAVETKPSSGKQPKTSAGKGSKT